MPDDWTAANITFQGGTVATLNALRDVRDSEGNLITVTAADDRLIMLSAAIRNALRGIPYLRLTSTAAQGANRVLTLLFER